jgi:hypothetical protein
MWEKKLSSDFRHLTAGSECVTEPFFTSERIGSGEGKPFGFICFALRRAEHPSVCDGEYEFFRMASHRSRRGRVGIGGRARSGVVLPEDPYQAAAGGKWYPSFRNQDF